MGKLLTFLRHKWHWARSSPLAWLSAVFLVVTAVVIALPGQHADGTPSDTRLRLWALVLQFVGGFTVLMDMTGKARENDHPGPLQTFLNWLRAARSTSTSSVDGISVSSVLTGGTLRSRVRREHKPDASIEEQISDMVFNVTNVTEELDSALREIDAGATRSRTAMEAEVRERKRKMGALRDSLRKSAVGNFTVLYFGAVCVLVGTLLSGVSPEIVRPVAGQWSAVWDAF